MARVEAPLLAAARRGLPWRCQRRKHDFRRTLSSRIALPDGNAEYRFSYKCRRCPATLHEVFTT